MGRNSVGIDAWVEEVDEVPPDRADGIRDEADEADGVEQVEPVEARDDNSDRHRHDRRSVSRWAL